MTTDKPKCFQALITKNELEKNGAGDESPYIDFQTIVFIAFLSCYSFILYHITVARFNFDCTRFFSKIPIIHR
ncbi:MAG: hypothetical protein ABJ275_04825 [Maricaulaceae bacterium]